MSASSNLSVPIRLAYTPRINQTVGLILRVCVHNGLVLAVLTRNEHCPPHVHVGTARWDARFLFSFWHNGVWLWDVTPAQNEPSAALLEELRQVLKQPENLWKARQLWWTSRQTVCLDNQQWDLIRQEVVSPSERRPGALAIRSARFEPQLYRTDLKLEGRVNPVKIEL